MHDQFFPAQRLDLTTIFPRSSKSILEPGLHWKQELLRCCTCDTMRLWVIRFKSPRQASQLSHSPGRSVPRTVCAVMVCVCEWMFWVLQVLLNACFWEMIAQEFEKYLADKDNYQLVNVPPTFMFNAKVRCFRQAFGVCQSFSIAWGWWRRLALFWLPPVSASSTNTQVLLTRERKQRMLVCIVSHWSCLYEWQVPFI